MIDIEELRRRHLEDRTDDHLIACSFALTVGTFRALLEELAAHRLAQQWRGIEEIAQLVALLRLNIEQGDRRMAIENCNLLINYCEKGNIPNDLSELRALHDKIQSRIESERPLVDSLVREMGTCIAPPAPQPLPGDAE